MPLKGQRILAQVNYLPHRGAAGSDDTGAVLRPRSRVEQLAMEIKMVHPLTAELGVCVATQSWAPGNTGQLARHP